MIIRLKETFLNGEQFITDSVMLLEQSMQIDFLFFFSPLFRVDDS